MLSANTTSSYQISHFVLICFPTQSIQSWQHWLSVPLALLFFVAIVANITIILAIGKEQHLHEPMYFFLCFLAFSDLVLCTTITPKILGILCFNLKAIDLPSCFLQMYIMNCFIAMESCTFLFMAYDRYIAICIPLRYNSIITNSFVAKALVFILSRNTLLALPVPVLASRLHYCSAKVIDNCICSNVSVSALACSDRTLNKVYQMVIAFTVLGIDLFFIGVSYYLILRSMWNLQAEGAVPKAFSTCSSHFILITFFYSVLLVLIFTNKMEKEIAPDIPILLNVLHFLLPPVLNPIVYGVRTKEIKQGIVRMVMK
ncbi:olfactory receptor 56A4-like [Ambystoma mexicanum]|uniref:olfactory receptor 56A4-like n=1 Tax=Ambystoma mexicanum TaxID=8296 RepID=UPI0037E8CC66